MEQELLKTLQPDLYIEDGMHLEVLRSNEQVVFLGCVKDFKDRTLRLIHNDGGSVPRVVYGTEVKLRGVWPRVGLVTYHGTVYGCTEDSWLIGDLSEWYGWERRGFYRQSISTEARVVRVYHPPFPSIKDYETDCRLLDFSANGALISCSGDVYSQGDILSVRNAAVMPNEDPIAFKCVVLRVERSRFHNLYGCRFHNMSISEQDHIAHLVFRLQQEERLQNLQRLRF